MTGDVDDWPTWQRPYPVPDGPCVMYHEWRDLLLEHWAVPADALRPLVPARLPIDTHGGQAWVGVRPIDE